MVLDSLRGRVSSIPGLKDSSKNSPVDYGLCIDQVGCHDDFGHDLLLRSGYLPAYVRPAASNCIQNANRVEIARGAIIATNTVVPIRVKPRSSSPHSEYQGLGKPPRITTYQVGFVPHNPLSCPQSAGSAADFCRRMPHKQNP